MLRFPDFYRTIFSQVTSKKIRAEQEKELKAFRESLKQEMKLLKHEVELLPKDRRKEELRMRKDRLEREHQDRVRQIDLKTFHFIRIHGVFLGKL